MVCSTSVYAQKSRKSKKRRSKAKTEQVTTTPTINEHQNAGTPPEETTTAKEEEPIAVFSDEVKIYKPENTNDGTIAVSDVIDIPNRSKDEIFTGILSFIYNNLNTETEAIEKVDFDNQRITLFRKLKQGEYKDATTYEYLISFQMGDNMLSFIASELKAEYKEKGFLPRKLDFEKLKPTEKERHKELIDEFSTLNSQYLHSIAKHVATTKPETVTHWSQIKAGKAVKGMNKTEVIMTLGRPAIERTTGTREKWMYGNEYVIIFTNGIVSSIID